MIVSLLIVKLAVVVWLYWRERSRRLYLQAECAHHIASAQAAYAWLEKVEREHAERRAAICAIITRRPPRRRWLRMAYRVAKLAT